MPHVNLNGAQLCYDRTGSGHPVVFLHGHSLDSRMWRGQRDSISHSYTFVSLDLRGHGESGAPPEGYSRSHYAADLSDFIDHIGLSKPSLVGHSLGGAVALEFALAHPERVTTLSLIGSGLEGFRYANRFAKVISKQKALLQREGKSPKFLRACLISPLFDGIRHQPELLALVQGMLGLWSGASWLEQTIYPSPRKLLVERLVELRVPTLVAVGDRDMPDFREIAAVLSENIPVARRAIIPKSAHLAPLENPDDFNDILLDFLGGAVGKALI
ncbi:alpha/beta hydrolase [Dehalococcoidia bacterium]|nr:alpha/beta hydrolase [Dehalococcoidia bacterium]